jgi:hypothetical protein
VLGEAGASSHAEGRAGAQWVETSLPGGPAFIWTVGYGLGYLLLVLFVASTNTGHGLVPLATICGIDFTRVPSFRIGGSNLVFIGSIAVAIVEGTGRREKRRLSLGISGLLKRSELPRHRLPLEE